MMEILRTSETSVHYDTTRRNIPEGCHHKFQISFWAIRFQSFLICYIFYQQNKFSLLLSKD
jgi:hypothetical protein